MEIIDDKEKEQKYLDRVLGIIDDNISKLSKVCENGLEDVRTLSKYHWETKSEMDYFEKAVTMNDVNHTATLTNTGLSKLRRLNKAAKKPYEGSIIVDFDGDQEKYYIGITSILENNDIVVNDWRSPISSLFYKSRLGPTSYKAPAGVINCNLLNRNHIIIKNRKIDNIVDSDMYLSDVQLQRVLSDNSSGKMKEIVATIQEEQDEVIRDEEAKKIIVQGCAGSGKTSVALHRLSYLLHNDKNSSSENMLIFSPSDAFSSYISNVLPELGDENVLQTTFSDFANAFVRKFDKIESFSEFLSNYYEGMNSDEKNKSNKFKYSKEYKDALDKFIQKRANEYRFQEDFSIFGATIPKEILNNILVNDVNSHLQEKINIVTDKVYDLIRNFPSVKKSSIRVAVARELIKPAFDPKAMYNKFLHSEEYIEAYKEEGTSLNKKYLEFPDLVGMLYLNFELMGYPSNNVIHHLVIDEVQDYSPLQMEMIAKMFEGATITALGDKNQTINPYHRYNSLEEIKEQLGRNSKYIELNKAYRSSPEIMNYVKEIVEDDKIVPVRNNTGNPVVKKEVDKSKLFETIVKDILVLKEKKYEKICIVTKSSKEARAIFEGLKDSITNICVLSDDNDYENNTLIAPSYNAKGLEFDAVICYNDKENSYDEDEKYLYYVACTRAQHDLLIYNEPKKLLNRGK